MKAPYITAEGAEALRSELRQLWFEERPVITRQVSEAAAMGDRSENAEYIYGKKRLREIDRRVRHLRKRLDEVRVVPPRTDACDRVYFGAWVTLLYEDGGEQVFRIVGPDEFDPDRGWISMDAPLARQLIGKQVDDDVQVRTPGGDHHCVILAVKY